MSRIDKTLASARTAEKRGAIGEALKLHIELIAAFPANPRARTALAALQARLAAAPGGIDETALMQLEALRAAGQFDPAQTLANALLDRFPSAHRLHLAVGRLGDAMGHIELAIAAHDRALELRPDSVEALVGLGLLLERAGRLDEALAYLAQAVLLEPDNPAGHYPHGRLLARLKRHAEAAAAFERVIALVPGHLDSWVNLAVARRALGLLEEAVSALAKAAVLAPERDEIALLLANARRQLADWSDPLPPERIATLGLSGAAVATDTTLALDQDPARQLARARRLAAHFAAGIEPASLALPPARERLRIGYVSTDFHTNALLHLMSGYFREIDRSRFETICYSIGPQAEHDPLRRELIAQCDAFHDLTDLDDAAAAALVRDHALDLAVDLSGFTYEARCGLFARRLAPVQASWLCYPGSKGAPFIDYLVADRHVIPPEQRAHYSEALALLPHSYQPNDNRRPIAPDPGTRADHGLPGDAFVFCTFNAVWKIGPDEFDVWMRILARVPGAVLWLYEPTPRVQANLRREAQRRAIDSARLVFAGHAPHAEHLARMAHADLFLDSFVCNAHTTASDALWAGVPLLTCPGQGFQARVAASLLQAAGLPELITPTREAYEEAAVALASHDEPLAGLRRRLAENRLTCPLFDTAVHTRAVERAWTAMIERARSGLPPADIAL